MKRAHWATVAMYLLLLPATAVALELECCVCDADCPTAGDRVCFNVVDQSACDSACQSVGCGTASVCIPGGACDAVEFCAETGDVPCSDGLDNNDNGLIDCQEPTCAGARGCQAAAPALSRPAGGVLALLLGVGGVWVLRRQSRRA